MLAVTVWQPWASLIACGAKRFETRDWGPGHRGELAIHAAARRGREVDDELAMPVVRSSLLRRGLDPWGIPFGAVVAVVDLAGLVGGRTVVERVARFEVPVEELSMGDFRAGRVCWDCQNARVLAEPVACRGSQGLWRLPDDVEARVRAQL